MKKTWLLLMCLALLLFALAACTQENDPELTADGYDAVLDAGYDEMNEDDDSLADEDSSGSAVDEPSLELDMPYIPEGNFFPFPFYQANLHGEMITQVDIGEREIFFVYFWATWCPNCVTALPGLAALAEEFGDRVGFLSLLDDFFSADIQARNMTARAGIPFHTISSRLPAMEPVMAQLRSGFVPTSALFDLEGNMIGDRIVGGNIASFRNAIEAALAD